MNLNKTIKKQKNNFIWFIIFMCFISILLPLILLLKNSFKVILWSYVVLIEVIIIIGVIKRIDDEILVFKHTVGKFRLKHGLFDRKISFRCEDVAFVDIEKSGSKEDIVFVFQSERYNKYLNSIKKWQMKRHPYAASYYYKLYESKPEYYYYYLVINKGKNKRYQFLNEIYSSCFNAFYSDDVINIIRKIR